MPVTVRERDNPVRFVRVTSGLLDFGSGANGPDAALSSPPSGILGLPLRSPNVLARLPDGQHSGISVKAETRFEKLRGFARCNGQDVDAVNAARHKS